jgi:hypothetical protein
MDTRRSLHPRFYFPLRRRTGRRHISVRNAPDEGQETIDAATGAGFAPYIHHGDEFTAVLQGSLDFDVDGGGTPLTDPVK